MRLRLVGDDMSRGGRSGYWVSLFRGKVYLCEFCYFVIGTCVVEVVGRDNDDLHVWQLGSYLRGYKESVHHCEGYNVCILRFLHVMAL